MSGASSVAAAWARLLAFVPTRRAAGALFLLAFVVYWIESLGWPMAKGRDTWDYLAYYLQLLDSNPPLSELQVFRTPLTPIVVGAPLDLGGVWALEVVFALLFATSIVAWSATALTFGRIPALFAALLLLGYPAYATIYHQASSDGVFATGLALFALGLARTLEHPTGRRFALLGVGIAALVLIRPANQVFLVVALVPLIVSAPWRSRLTLDGRLPAGRARTPCRLGRRQRCSLRRHDRRARRERLGPVPSCLPGRRDDLAGERRRLARAGRPHRARGPPEAAVRGPRRPARRRICGTARTTRPCA